MDSLTQIVLGAAVGEVVLGKKLGNRAMLWGAIAGTVPDLDVYLKYFVDDITSTEMHRGFSHSFIFAVLMAPILGWVAQKIHRKRKEVTLINWSWMFFWTIVTHPLLDAHTTWGTQFFWPLDYRLAYQNIFVIDPLYTIPFLLFLSIAVFHKRNNPKRKTFNRVGLIISSGYMVLTLVFKWIAHNEFKKKLVENKIEYVELDSKPTPLNSFLWTAQVKTNTGLQVAYYSLFDSKEIEFSKEYPFNQHLIEPYLDQKVIQQLIKISTGWYFIEQVGGKLFFWDIRFGQLGLAPNNSPFIWGYELKIDQAGKVHPERNKVEVDNMGQILSELIERITGN